MSNLNYIPSVYQEFIFYSRYSRYIESKSRRETWSETVERYFNFFDTYLKENFQFELSHYRKELEIAILEQRVMPSMRGLMTAGPALKRDEAAVFNCSYLPIDTTRSFDETIYILMLGVGEGFTVEFEDVNKLPELPDEFHHTDTTVIFEDSRIGWAKGYREFVSLLMNGQIAKYDLSKLRLKGARLKTFGGRSSGPDPLKDLLEFTKILFIKAAGRKLTTLDCHDLTCKIADIVVVGGVRRSALISLSDLSDEKMKIAKNGAWWKTNPQRRLANNSAVYEEKPEIGVFMREWLSLYDSKSGERGIFSRKAVKKIIEYSNKFRRDYFGEEVRIRDPNYKFGVNPCSEIILRPYEFCNLTSVQVREYDTLETLSEKVRIATILGTIQSCLTKFKYLNKRWQRNCEDERLLGVSLNGIFDNSLMNGSQGEIFLIDALLTLRKIAIKTNLEFSKLLGINSSVAITCVKPEGTTSAFNGTSSGLHPAHSEYYIRYVRNDKKDPLTQFMIDQGVSWEDDHYDPDNMICFKFPMKSAINAVCRKHITAISHLELWKLYQIHWCEHKPSVTISVKEDDWMKVGSWVYDNFEWISGVSFLPANESDHIYTQAPFTDCTKVEYDELLAQTPDYIDWGRLSEYEHEDMTTNAQTLACAGVDPNVGCFI